VFIPIGVGKHIRDCIWSRYKTVYSLELYVWSSHCLSELLYITRVMDAISAPVPQAYSVVESLYYMEESSIGCYFS
jgi:hypothetical protein